MVLKRNIINYESCKGKYRNFTLKYFFPFTTVIKNIILEKMLICETISVANGKYMNLNQFNGLMNKAADVLVKFSGKLCTFAKDIKLCLVGHEFVSRKLVAIFVVRNITRGQSVCSSNF